MQSEVENLQSELAFLQDEIVNLQDELNTPENEKIRVYLIGAPLVFSLTDQRCGNVDSCYFSWRDFPVKMPIEELFDSLTVGYNMDYRDVEIPSYEPPIASQIKFDGYILPNGASGEDWIPKPDDVIGLAVKYANAQSTGRLS